MNPRARCIGVQSQEEKGVNLVNLVIIHTPQSIL
jgi:hypothetical protein